MAIRYFPLLFLWVPLAGSLHAENWLQLKSKRLQTGTGLAEAFSASPLRLATGRSHIIVQFRSAPSSTQMAELERRGVAPLRYVPDFAFLASVPDYAALDGLHLARTVRLEAEDRLSPMLPADGQIGMFLAEFHPDVDRTHARILAYYHGLSIREHPDLLPDQLLLQGAVSDARRLAEWDEVAYIYPASPDLAAGRRVHACSGPVTSSGLMGQYVALAGNGWDGPGMKAVQLGVHFSSTPADTQADIAKAEILRAFAEWSRYVKVTFASEKDALSPRTVNVLFAAAEHGDGNPFDGPGRVLAHTYYPAPPNPEPIAGDMHFDNEEAWTVDGFGTYDLFAAALHEAGHALGLGHSDNPNAVMYPYYRRSVTLNEEDIGAIQQMYAAREADPGADDPGDNHPIDAALTVSISNPAESPVFTNDSSIALAGAAEGGTGEVRVTYSSSRGFAGTATGGRAWAIAEVPLEPGLNVIAVTALDDRGNTALDSRTVMRLAGSAPPVLTIVYPDDGQAVPADSVEFSGTAAHPLGLERVTWSNSRGGYGIAAGTTQWVTGPIALAPGPNVVTITALALDGNTAEKSVTVLYEPPKPHSDSTSPAITITSPATKTPAVYASTIQIQGRATDNTAVARVVWSDSMGDSGTANGTAYWRTGPIPLREGANAITIEAFDAAGNAGRANLVVTRKVRASSAPRVH